MSIFFNIEPNKGTSCIGFFTQRNLLNALMTDNSEVVKRFQQESIPSKVSVGEGKNGVILTLLDSTAQDKDVIQVGSYSIKYEVYKQNLNLNKLEVDQRPNCLVEVFGKREDELLIYNILGQKKVTTDPRGVNLARPDYMKDMPPADSILPPAYSSYITHTNDDKGYEMNCSPLQKLQELRVNYDESNTGNKNIFTSIDKVLEYTRVKSIYLNTKPGQYERSEWRAICLVPSPLYQKVREDYYSKRAISISKDMKDRVSMALSSLGLFNSDGFVHEQILFIRTDLYISWKDEDPVALCEKDGSTKWYQKNASGDGKTENNPKNLTGTIPERKEMYRLVLIGADAIHYTHKYPAISSSIPAFTNISPAINKDVQATGFTFLKIAGDLSGDNKNLLANSYQHMSMRRVRKKIDNGLQELPEDAGIFAIDLIA